jgi:hypothetical protein
MRYEQPVTRKTITHHSLLRTTKENMKHKLWLLLLLLLLPACTTPDLGNNALAITSPASGTAVSGTVAVQIGTASPDAVSRIDLYVKGQGSTNKGILVGSSVNTPHVISWNTLGQPNATNLDLVAIAVDTEGKEIPSQPLSVRTQNSGTPSLQYLVGYTLAPRVSATQLGLVSDVLLTDGVLAPEGIDLSQQEVSLQPAQTSQRNYLLEWQWQPFAYQRL